MGRSVVYRLLPILLWLFVAGCGARTGDGPEAGGADACAARGTVCAQSRDCCDGLGCREGRCEPPCGGPGAPCSGDGSCCDGACNNGVCAASCTPDGAACSQPSDCCSQICDNARCGLAPCLPLGSACGDDAQCCDGACIGGMCGGIVPTCDHHECDVGGPLSPECSPCAANVCQFDPYCCDVAWDEACVSEADMFCGLGCQSCLPAGALCQGSFECCSQSCISGVCQETSCVPDGGGCNIDQQCCSQSCNGGVCGPGGCDPDGFPCMTGATCCSQNCTNGFCGAGNGCTHDTCTVGAPLDPGCDSCTLQVCALDPFCCQFGWDGLCVLEAQQFCGLQCGMCTPNGQPCMQNGQCCSQSCNGNVCGPPCLPNGALCSGSGDCCSGFCSSGLCAQPCLPNGAPCNFPSECCSASCNGNVCGPPSCAPDGAGCMLNADCCSQSCSGGICMPGVLCPSDGSACGDCLSQSCCNALIACLGAPSCASDLGCFLGCIGNGGGPISCFGVCISDPLAFQVVLCAVGNCGSTCFGP